MFNMIDFIERKRDRHVHSKEELRAFVEGVRDAAIPDYQTAAWLMAAFLNDLTTDELGYFTHALATSGDVVSLPTGKKSVDKHSTGGVGDKTTLIVAPLVAACGLNVAKLSGRGLGFTGGTVDKLEAIPGMNVHLSTEDFKRQVGEIGIALSGHSMALAPAEGKFYALRDVTGTVPSISLIASSIVSKKIAGGADAFVFDVKCGSGAFMEDEARARALARVLVDLSASLGKKSSCVISDMEQPLGEWIGNAVEVFEAIEVLSGRGPSDTRELSLVLAAEMLYASGMAEDASAALNLATAHLDNGDALRKFAETIAAQGGNAEICTEPKKILPSATKVHRFEAREEGAIAKIDARTIGNAIRALGGGRMRKEDEIDLAVGIRLLKKIGDRAERGEALAEVHYNDENQLKSALPYLESAYACAPTAERRALVIGRVN